MCDYRDLSSSGSIMASPTADGVANLTETGNPGDVATPGDKVDDVHEEKPELEEPKMTPSTTLALLQAEMGSVVKSMSDLVKGQGGRSDHSVCQRV